MCNCGDMEASFHFSSDGVRFVSSNEAWIDSVLEADAFVSIH